MLATHNHRVISVYGGTPVEEINAIPGLVEELKKMGERSEVGEETRSEDSEELEELNQISYLEKNKDRVEEIGERLNNAGGYNLMLWAVKQMPEESQHELECAWHGIGEWQF